MRYRQVRINKLKSILAFGFFFFLSISLFAQNEIIVTKEFNDLKWEDFSKTIEQNYDVRFFYNMSGFPDFKVVIKGESQPLHEILTENLKKYGYKVSISKSGDVFLTRSTQIISDLPEDFFKTLEEQQEIVVEKDEDFASEETEFLETASEYIAESIIVGTYERGALLKKVTLKGTAKNSVSGEPVIGATIMEKATSSGVATDHNGNFEIILNKGKHILIIQSVNIAEKRIEVDLRSNGSIELLLDDKVVMLDDVIVRGQRNNKVESTQMGVEKLTIKSVKKIPLVFGEKDVVKVALLLPGVKTLGEGSAGFNVRGSPTDQNLFYINNLPIYNTSHVAGFFSAFNSDAISEFSLYKSNIPISYGGRLSSIFDIKAKEGNKDEVTANGGISLITGRALVEGPINRGKSSFLVGLRSTYSDWAISMMNVDQDIKDSKANFIDAVVNLSFKLNKKNNLNIFAYGSNDQMNLVATSTKYDYNNIGASVIWKHNLEKPRDYYEVSFAHSIYDFNEEVSDTDYEAYKHGNSIQHSEFKLNFNIHPNKKHTLNFGINSILYQIDRGKKEPIASSTISVLDLGEEKGLESGIFFSDEWKATKQLTLYAGVRYNLFSSLGPQKVYKYVDGLPMIPENIQDTLNFGSGEFIKTNGGLDIRVAANYRLGDNVSVKASYNRLHQNIFMLSNTIAVSPNFKWKLSDYNIKPSIGDQISAGFFTNILANRYEVSLEGYYKKVQNLLEIKDGEDLFLNRHVETSTLQGDLDAYGFEFMIKKLYGKLTGWINYTYSKSKVLVDDVFKENQINGGESYLSNFDKPHAVNLVATYDFSRRLSMSGNVVYSTGRPITYPTGYYYWNDVRIINYSKRNEYRIPDYFRVDMSLTLEGNLKKNKLAHGSWTLSVYNLLGRNNAYSVYFKQENGRIKGYKLSIFAAPLVSLTYNIKLGNYEN